MRVRASRNVLQDIALVTNATPMPETDHPNVMRDMRVLRYITEDLGRKLESITAEDFGWTPRVRN